MSKSMAMVVLGVGALLFAIMVVGCSDDPPSPTPTPVPTNTPTPAPTSTPTPALATPLPTPTRTALSLDEYLTQLDCASLESEEEPATYGDLSADLAEFAERMSALAPPSEVAVWHQARLDALQAAGAFIDQQTQDEEIDFATLLLLAGILEEHQPRETEAAAQMSDVTRQRVVDAGCIDPEGGLADASVDTDSQPDAPDAHGDNIADATPVGPGEVASGSLDGGDDKDVFVFHAEAGKSYEAKLSDYPFGAFGSKTGPLMAVYDSTGQEIARIEEDSARKAVKWTAEDTGNHYVVLGDGASSGSYSLTVSPIAAPMPTAAPVSIPTSIPTPAPMATPTAEPTSTAMPKATATPTPTPMDTPVPAPANTPVPTPMATPTPGPAESEVAAYAQVCEVAVSAFASEMAMLGDDEDVSWGDFAVMLDALVGAYGELTPPRELQEYHDASLRVYEAIRDHARTRPSEDSFIEEFLGVVFELFGAALEIGLDTTKTDAEKEQLIEGKQLEILGEFFGPDFVAASQAVDEAREALPEETLALLDDAGCYSDILGEDQEEAVPPAPFPTATAADTDDDHGDSIEHATAATVGEVVQGSVDFDGDEDFFVFQAEEGIIYRLDVALGTLPTSALELYDPDGQRMGRGNWEDSGAWIIWKAPITGKYFAKVLAGYGQTDSIGTYTLTVSQSDIADDHGDGIESATTITIGETVAGAIDYFVSHAFGVFDPEEDYFAFQAEEGESYRIELALGTLDSSWLQLDDDGDWIEDLGQVSNYGDSPTSRIVWEAPSSGEYYVIVTSSCAPNVCIGSYTLSVDLSDTDAATPVATPTPTAAPPLATVVMVGEAASGNLDNADDRGFFVFGAQEGVLYQIDAELGTLHDSVLRLLDSEGRDLAYNDDHGDSLASRIMWTAPSSGRYYVVVEGYGAGSYTLTITRPGAKTATPSPTPTSSASTPSSGGTLSLAIARDPFPSSGFSPYDSAYSGAEAQIQSLIFSRLAHRGASGLEPDLAESWSVSSDGAEWTLRLRDARFHDGRPVTAADVIASIQARTERFGGLPDIAHHSQTDDLTLSVQFAGPALDFLEVMSEVTSPIVPRDMLETAVDELTDLIGSGPFMPSEYDPGIDLVLERNPGYHESGLPYLDRIRLLVIVDPTTRVAAFRTGQADYLGYPYGGLPAPSPEFVSDAVAAGGFAAAFPSALALWFDTQNPPFDNRNVRLAVLRAIDTEYFENVLGAGELQGVIPSALFPAWTTAGDEARSVEDWHSVDLEAARGLLAQAGYPDGFSTTVRVRQGLLVQVAQLLKDTSASVDISVGIEALGFDEYRNPAEMGMKLAWVGASVNDVEGFLRDHFTVGGQYNHSRTHITIPALDPSRPESVDPVRELLAEEIYYIPLHTPVFARSERVKGPITVYDLYDIGWTLREVWVE